MTNIPDPTDGSELAGKAVSYPLECARHHQLALLGPAACSTPSLAASSLEHAPGYSSALVFV